ncbi:hypothetical protein [Cryptosporangium aurantiacum]|uniref:Mce-associated membrane protein n=1 Tax=Cryptosporangium aurantiacum TaxID=134849 RepID=A0A1M7QSR8_9ACTN|nr:hypothetical protein [Cryptosporangium aurantiacum]SHN34831.1 hypothetical protein SAMN05443668_105314 [Cryptosporangium aurantiacum]
MRVAPPPPELTSRSWERRRKRRRRRRTVLLSLVAVVLSLTVTTVTAVLVFRSGSVGPKTPQAAAEKFLRSMAKNSINEFEQTLCEPKRHQAGGILREFNSGLVDVGQELEDMSWRITNETRRSAEEVELDVDVTFAVIEKRTQRREETPFPMRMQAVKDRGWYICEIQILTL